MFIHLLRHSLFMTNIIEGQMNRHKERPRKAYIEEIIRQADCNRYVDIERLAFNREK